jgi:phospholipid/cholesterol/gamma-HCH transport system substrate-binding protein
MAWFQSVELKVGFLVVVVASLIAYMSMQVSQDPSYMGRSTGAWFLISDAGGVVKNSAVRMAGIPIGIIKDIRLQDGMARIDMSLRPDIKLTVSAHVEIKAQGILGDKHVELNPGIPTDPPLPANGQILNVKDKGSIDNLISQVSEITGSLKSVAKTLQESVEDDGTRRHILGRIVSNIERITADVSNITADNKEKVNDIMDQVRKITGTLDEMVNDPGDQGLKKQWKKLTKSLDRVESIMKNVDEITAKINKGEGTIGKLINDEETVEELNTAISGVNSMLDTANKTSTAVDFHSEYQGQLGLTKSYVGIKIQPGLDRHYFIQIVDDPAGVVEKTETQSTTNGSLSDVREVKTYHNKIKLTALFAKNFWDWTVKAGLMENVGGVGVDYYIYRRQLKLSMDAYDFSSLNLRTQIQYNFYKGIYVIGGMSDMLNRSGKQTSYLGAGLTLTNDDLKLLLSKASF